MINLDDDSQEFYMEELCADMLLDNYKKALNSNIGKWDRKEMIESSLNVIKYKIPFRIRMKRKINNIKQFFIRIFKVF